MNTFPASFLFELLIFFRDIWNLFSFYFVYLILFYLILFYFILFYFYFQVAEMRGHYEVQLDDFKLAVVRLKAQLRLLCSSQPLQDIYESFEAHTQR